MTISSKFARSISHSLVTMMAANIFRLTALSGRNGCISMRGACCFKAVSAKVILPSSNASLKGIQTTRIHTSSPVNQELFMLAKNRKAGAQHWYTERIVAVGLLGLIPVGILYPMQLIDQSLAVLVPLHAYWGVNSILGDYFWRPGLPAAQATLVVVSLLTAAGLMYINVNDVGICKLLGMIMKI